jgi:hypothetical protein
VSARLAALLAAKDIPVDRRRGGPYDRYIVLIHTDEQMITPDLLHAAVAALDVTPAAIDEAYALMSYHPGWAEFPTAGR